MLKSKRTTFLLILLVSLLALRDARSIYARGNQSTTGIKSLGNQPGLVLQGTNTPTSGPGTTAEPVIISTPLPDGSIRHIMADGQSLWTIAEAYEVLYTDLLELNDLESDAIVQIGDEVIIAPSYTPTSTPIGEPSSTPPPRYSHTPSLGTPQATDNSFSPTTPLPSETPIVEPRFRSSGKNPLIVLLAVVVSGGSLVAAIYFSLRERN